MVELVRMVIWDLDETFWKGTLSEGPIEYQEHIHDIVVSLAERGIISSICSKNDIEPVKRELQVRGIWDYFVFPSVNWEPKGQRIARLIETVQLRPATVMLIDDNHLNLNEARHYVPEIQTSNELFIPEILASPLFVGKPANKLSRLKQYKLLEKRKSDELASGADNIDFLRECKLNVEINYDIEKHLDRVIELVNRTNQLNFTKRRLPEDHEEARTALLAQLRDHTIVAGIVHVSDKYGDYGLCGYFTVRTVHGHRDLLDFCFSCRILNMGVEQWVYDKLMRPKLTVVGDVLTDLFADHAPIDWINRAVRSTKGEPGIPAALADQIVLHGGCELNALAFYLEGVANSVHGEFNGLKDGVEVRTDHSALLRLALEPQSPPMLAALRAVGYAPAHVYSIIPTAMSLDAAVVLSFGMDSLLPLYRHKTLGFRVPFVLPIPYPNGIGMDITTLDRSFLRQHINTPWATDAVDALARDYLYEGPITETLFKDNLRVVFAATASARCVFTIGANEFARGETAQPNKALSHYVRVNSWTKDAALPFSNVRCLNIRDFVSSEADIHEHPQHFSRAVYYRMFLKLTEELAMARTRGGD